MSYILDALKKAESERKLGQVPNVYMDPMPIARSEESTSVWQRPWTWAVAALLAAAGIAAWWLKSSPAEAPLSGAPMIVAQAESAADGQAHGAGSAPVAEQPGKPVPKKEEARHADKKDAPQKKPAQRAVKPAASVAAPAENVKGPQAKKARQENESRQDVPLQKPAARAEPGKSDKGQTATAGEQPVQQASDVQVATLHELPQHIQRSIPPITIGGYIYSPNPAGRSMLLNNRLVREGEQAASGLILEKMMPKEAVLNYQGQRFRLPY